MDNYLGYEICATIGDWMVVYDGKYNYYLFNFNKNRVIKRFEHGRMPNNQYINVKRHGPYKLVEYYSTFDKALKYMLLNFLNKGFIRHKGCYVN